jgi:hypothetical protein
MPFDLFVPVTILLTMMAAISCWRIIIGAIAARPLSDRLGQAAGLKGPGAADFHFLETLCTAAGALANASHGTGAVRIYYRVVRAAGRLLPLLGAWSEHEMIVCSRYLAVQVDRCLATNTDCARRVRSL